MLVYFLLKDSKYFFNEKQILSYNTRPSYAMQLNKLGIKLNTLDALIAKSYRLKKGQ